VFAYGLTGKPLNPANAILKITMQRNSPDLSHPTYRPDIDGLRAVAVLAVVIYHAFPDVLPGGFIGVDVFFVISGFLISSIIFDNLNRNQFSFVEFYKRRINRIFPALIVVLLSCLIAGWILLIAPDFKRLGKHIASGAGFVSNFILLKESGYFDASAEMKPLLHLWSLAIEEQFYIIWPLLLWCAWKLRLNRYAVVLTILLVSFLLNIRTSHDPNEIARLYYSPATRFWELLVGAMIAGSDLPNTAPLRIELINRRFANARSCTGAALLIVGLFFISNDKPFPGWYALLPTLGAALLISSGPNAWINQELLSNRVAVWFGLISYPLYLWHWPLLSFARIINTGTPEVAVRFALVGLAIALAWLTKSYVEKPLRFASKSGVIPASLILAMVVIGSSGYYLLQNQGLPERYGVPALQMEPGRYQCEGVEENSGCSFGNPDSKKLVVVWGDSHAEQYTNALRITLGDSYRFITATNGSCFMGEKVQFPEIGSKRDCSAAINKIKSLRGQAVYAVIRVQRWHGYGVISKSAVENAVNDAITAYDLHPEKVIILGATPDVDIECALSNYYKRPLVGNKPCDSVEPIKAIVKDFSAITRAMQVPSNVSFIYPYEIACPNDSCTVIDGSVAYFEDIHHFSTQGAQRVMPAIAAALRENPK
jgi:peptidoglycan/LPS O-acetylase OafA/YrhL